VPEFGELSCGIALHKRNQQKSFGLKTGKKKSSEKLAVGW